MKQAVKITLASWLLASALWPISVTFRFSDSEGVTRIVFEGSEKFTYQILSSEERLEILVSQPVEFRLDAKEPTAPFTSSRLVAGITHENRGSQSLFSVAFKEGFKIQRHFVLENPFRLVFDLEPVQKPALPPLLPLTSPAAPFAAKETQAAAPQENPLPMASPSAKKKSIETICIDAGHGGEDLGAVGKGKTLEKNITLAIAKKLKKIVETKLGLRVIMTRSKDEEISLNQRTSMANNQQAQMFISIHANSSFRRSAFGSETYYVSLKATDQEALELAQKENRSNENIGEEIQNDELKLILWNMAQTEYIKESSRLAELIQNELNDLLSTRDRGVKQAPFRVLMRSAMPSVLIEVAFLSNRAEEKKLLEDAFQDNVTRAIFTGISKFIAEYNHSLK